MELNVHRAVLLLDQRPVPLLLLERRRDLLVGHHGPLRGALLILLLMDNLGHLPLQLALLEQLHYLFLIVLLVLLDYEGLDTDRIF